MKRFKFIFAALLVVSGLVNAGCTTPQLPKVDTSQRLEVDHGFIAEPIRQNGQNVDRQDLLKQLSETKEGAHALRNFDLTLTSGILLSGAAGYLIGYGAFHPDSSQRLTFIGAGVGVFGGALLISNLAMQQLANAGDIYNKRFKTLLTPLRGGGAALVQTTF